YEDLLNKAIRNLAQSLPDQVMLYLNDLAMHYSFVTGATTRANPRLLNEISEAIRDQRPVEVTYYTASRDARGERVLHPYALRNVRGDWHLIAFDSFRNEVRIFALNRIERWHILHTQKFSHIEGFSLESYMSSAFLSERGGTPERIEIHFDAYQARYIRERQWHETQEPLEELLDGGVILRFTSGALEEIQRWVLGFGSHATVLAPPALRAAVANESIKMAKKYEAK
ncbi:MAG: WYL domain-containing protein, partial [Chloroflexi bacterium]